jgi:hypothetical protein
MAGRAGNRDAALRAVPAERAVPPVLQRDPGPRAQTPASPPGLPKYLRLERKELLIWPDQVTDLSILARGAEQEPSESGGADNHEHAYPCRRSAPAQPVPGFGGYDRGRAPAFAGT